MTPAEKYFAEKELTTHFNHEITISAVRTISGGCINRCFVIETNAGKFFLKINSKKAFPEMFAAEAKGLQLMNGAVAGIAPDVIHFCADGENQYLFLQYIEPGYPAPDFAENFAERLAGLHRTTNSDFGLDHDNYIGSLPQQNQFEKSWTDFFMLHRIQPQLQLAIDHRKISKNIFHDFEILFRKLPHIFPSERPALIHGDLWGGNAMATKNGYAVLVDPAVYYGHREMDLAMMHLFGGFDRNIFRFYHDIFPLQEGFENRKDIYNLYPLLVHVNLFGGGYAAQVEGIVRRFV